MNINKISSGLPAEFMYEYYDEAGVFQTAEIKLKLKRLTFRKVTATAFQKAMGEIQEHPEEVAQLLCDVLDEWNIFTDDDEKEMFPITVDSIADREPGFVSALAQATFERLFPNPQIAKRSQDGLAPAANVENSTAE